MTWLEKTIQILRTYINDLDSVEYTDSRLTEIIIVSAYSMSFEVSFDVTYSIDIDLQTISPDPSQSFITLLAIKAAMLVYNGEAKASTKYGFTINDGPSSINATKMIDVIQKNLENMQRMYADARLRYIVNGSVGEVIMTPTTNVYYEDRRTNL